MSTLRPGWKAYQLGLQKLEARQNEAAHSIAMIIGAVLTGAALLLFY